MWYKISTKIIYNYQNGIHLFKVYKWFVYLCHDVIFRSSSASTTAKRKFSEPEPRNVAELADAISLFREC